MSALLALVLAAQSGGAGSLPAAPVQLWQVVWHRPLVAPAMLEWKPREFGGPAVDPVTGLVVVGTRDGLLRAFDPDGALVWSMQAGARFEAAPRIDGDTVYVGNNDGRLYALEIATGKIRWTYDAHEEVGTTPTVAGDLVLVMTLQDTLVAVEARTGVWKWHHRREPREGFTVHGAAPALVDGGLAIGAYSDGTVAALDLATGAVKWERKVAPAGDFMDIDGLRTRSGRLYAAAYSGAVLGLDAATGREVWQFKTPNAYRVALGAGFLVAVTATQVVGISPREGTALWAVPLEGTASADPVVVAGRVLVPNTKSLLWIDGVSGRVLRRFDPGTGVSAPVAALGRRVYVLSNAGDLIALDVS